MKLIAAILTTLLGATAAMAQAPTGVTSIPALNSAAAPSTTDLFPTSQGNATIPVKQPLSALAANPTGTIGTSAVNGSAATFMRSDGAPAAPTASSGTLGLAKCDNATITCNGGMFVAVGVSGSSPTLSVNTPAFYLATNGSDSNPCTFNSPCATIAQCHASMSTSTIKTCFMRAGTYMFTTEQTSLATGETYAGYPGDAAQAVILDFSGIVASSGYGIACNTTCSNVTIENFTIRGTPSQTATIGLGPSGGGTVNGFYILGNYIDATESCGQATGPQEVIYGFQPNNVYIQGNTIIGCTQGVTNTMGATWNDGLAHTGYILTDNNIRNGHGIGRFGVELQTQNPGTTVDNLHVDRNTFSGYCTMSAALSVVATTPNTGVGDTVWGNLFNGTCSGGVWSLELATVTGIGVSVEQNTFTDSVGVEVGACVGCEVENNIFNPAATASFWSFGPDGGYNKTEWIGINTVNTVSVDFRPSGCGTPRSGPQFCDNAPGGGYASSYGAQPTIHTQTAVFTFTLNGTGPSTVVNLTDAATIAVAPSAAVNVYSLILTGSGHTLNNPTGAALGQSLEFLIQQPQTGPPATMLWGSGYGWANGTAPTLTSAAGATTDVRCIVTSTAPTLLCNAPVNSDYAQVVLNQSFTAPASTSVYTMMGLSSGTYIAAPATTGQLEAIITGTVVGTQGTPGAGISLWPSYGFGTSGPANGGNLSGTQVAQAQSYIAPIPSTLRGSSTANVVASTSYFMPLSGLSSANTTELNAETAFASATTLSGLYCAVSTAPGSGHSTVCTMRVATSFGGTFAAGNETCTIANTAVTCQDTTHTDVIAANGAADINIAPGASAVSANASWNTNQIVSTGAEQFVLMFQLPSTVPGGFYWVDLAGESIGQASNFTIKNVTINVFEVR